VLPFGDAVSGVRMCSRACYETFLRTWATASKGPHSMIRRCLDLFEPSGVKPPKKNAKEFLARVAQKSKDAKNSAAQQLRGALSTSDAGRDCILQSLLCADLFAEPDMVGTYLGVAAHACNDLKLPRISLELARKALKYVPKDSLFCAACHSLCGTVLNQQGKHQIAYDHFVDALKILKQLSAKQPNGERDGDVASCILSIGNVLIDQNKADQALPHIDEALSMRKTILAKKAAKAAEAAQAAAAAAADNKEALVIAAPASDESVDIAECNKTYALAYAKLGRQAEALTLVEDALAVYGRLRAEPHADRASCENSYGVVLTALGRQADALAAHKRALELYKTLAKGAVSSLDIKTTQKYIDDLENNPEKK
jgi:tetratricopeptide (TPR) repeat protein